MFLMWWREERRGQLIQLLFKFEAINGCDHSNKYLKLTKRPPDPGSAVSGTSSDCGPLNTTQLFDDNRGGINV